MAFENIEEYNARQYDKKSQWHRAQANLPIKEKMRLMLEMQKSTLPLIARRRPLKWYEKPWNIEP